MAKYCDVLILGSGVAGLGAALHMSRSAQVLVATKRSLSETATAWAQGGIASVLDPHDTVEAHIEDTLRTGCGLSKPEVVDAVVRDGPDCIAELVSLGAQFTTKQQLTREKPSSGNTPAAGHLSHLDLTMEGGHSARRIVHVADQTGREIQRVLTEACRARETISFLEQHMAIDLIETSRFGGPRRVVGAYLLNEETGEVEEVVARATVLATGGAGKVYLYTSNPDVATGDGIAMAYRAGARLRNMEFFQFHPTCFFDPKIKTFLISEALRGEGGVLRLQDGSSLMESHDERGDLAPRDVVARAIDFEMKRTGQECVHLDVSKLADDELQSRFPFIFERCLRANVDIRKEPIPVVPAAHYMCGGVEVDMHAESTLPGLWAVGEVASTGLHGANRLASNSLLEGLVFARKAAQSILRTMSQHDLPKVPAWDVGRAAPSDEAVVVSQNWDELRRFMWNYVGIVRSAKRLHRAARRIALLKDEIREYYWEHLVTRDLLELRNIADVAEIIVSSAAFRPESRGLHFTLDHPERDPQLDGCDTVIAYGNLPYLAQPDQ